MGQRCLRRRYLWSKPQGRRPVCRPWEGSFMGVDDGLRRRGKRLGPAEESETYEDRSDWQEIVRCLPTDRLEYLPGGW